MTWRDKLRPIVARVLVAVGVRPDPNAVRALFRIAEIAKAEFDAEKRPYTPQLERLLKWLEGQNH